MTKYEIKESCMIVDPGPNVGEKQTKQHKGQFF